MLTPGVKQTTESPLVRLLIELLYSKQPDFEPLLITSSAQTSQSKRMKPHIDSNLFLARFENDRHLQRMTQGGVLDMYGQDSSFHHGPTALRFRDDPSLPYRLLGPEPELPHFPRNFSHPSLVRPHHYCDQDDRTCFIAGSAFHTRFRPDTDMSRRPAWIGHDRDASLHCEESNIPLRMSFPPRTDVDQLGEHDAMRFNVETGSRYTEAIFEIEELDEDEAEQSYVDDAEAQHATGTHSTGSGLLSGGEMLQDDGDTRASSIDDAGNAEVTASPDSDITAANPRQDAEDSTTRWGELIARESRLADRETALSKALLNFQEERAQFHRLQKELSERAKQFYRLQDQVRSEQVQHQRHNARWDGPPLPSLWLPPWRLRRTLAGLRISVPDAVVATDFEIGSF